MLFTVKEMEVLCVFHAGTLSATLEAFRDAMNGETSPGARLGDMKSATEKLAGMMAGDVASLAFDPEQ